VTSKACQLLHCPLLLLGLDGDLQAFLPTRFYFEIRFVYYVYYSVDGQACVSCLLQR